LIVFKKIKYKNFLSTGNTPIEIEFNKSPTSLVIGKNGSGKSTLLDALCFVLFNKPFRIIKKDQMINTINNGDCVVEVEFDVGTKSYKIVRKIKPNGFEIYCDGTLINQDASNIDYQKYLETNIMRLNYRSFIQVVLLGSSSYEPFMKMRASYRREVIEQILDINVFTKMDQMLRNDQGDLSKQITELSHNCDLLESKYNLENKHFLEIKNRNLDDIGTKKIKLEEQNNAKRDYLERIQQLDADYKQQQELIKDKNKVQSKLSQLEKIEAKIEHNLDTHNKNLDFFSENAYCPTCTQPIDEQFRYDKQAKLKTKVETLNDGMKKLVEEITTTETKLTEINSISDKMNEIYVETSKLKTSIDEIKKYSDNLHNEILLLENNKENTETVGKQLEEIRIELEKTKVQRDKVTEQKKYIDVMREVLSDKGARAKIIKKYLPIMNTLINQFLQSMDFFVNFELDEEFNETIKSRFRDTFNYNNFSEGEKMRIDLALLFTWRQIAKMKNSTNTNLLILDEIFDSSLDGTGTEDFFKIIKNMPKENVFIISHKGDILFDKFTNIIKFDKVQNFSRLEYV